MVSILQNNKSPGARSELALNQLVFFIGKVGIYGNDVDQTKNTQDLLIL